MSTMKNLKEKLTRENIRADLLRATKRNFWELWGITAAVLAMISCVNLLVWMDVPKLLPLFIGLSVIALVVTVRILAKKLLSHRETRKNVKVGQFFVAKTSLRCGKIEMYGQKGRPKDICVLELAMFGKCYLQYPFYPWSKNWNLTLDGLCNFSHEGDEFYVVYTPDQPLTALIAYPACCFVWDGEKQTKE